MNATQFINGTLLTLFHPNGIKANVYINQLLVEQIEKVIKLGAAPFLKVFIKQTTRTAIIIDQHFIRIKDLPTNEELEWKQFLLGITGKSSPRYKIERKDVSVQSVSRIRTIPQIIVDQIVIKLPSLTNDQPHKRHNK